MNILTQFTFSEDYGQFSANELYVLTGIDRRNDRVAITHVRGIDDAELIMWDRSAFENTLTNQDGQMVIIPCNPQRQLPPWLKDIEGCLVERLDSTRSNSAKKTHQSRIYERAKILSTVAKDFESILGSKNPRKLINKTIRSKCCEMGKANNVTRMRSQLLIWMAFGQQELALFPAYRNCGTAGIADEQSNKHKPKKRGRPSKRGKEKGCNVDRSMLKKIENGFKKHSELRKSLRRIYYQSLISEFGCIQAKRKGKLATTQPDNQPFPSEQQFRYHINKILGKNVVREKTFGANKTRRTETANIGSYVDGISYIGEGTQFDAQIIDERIQSFDGTVVLDKSLHVTSIVDEATGMVLGLGGGLGAEDVVSHQAMMFCMAIDKKIFCQLFGIQIESCDWPSIGIPSSMLGDRGPGMSSFATHENSERRTFGRSFQGQDKPNIESSHDKLIKIEGQQPTQFARLNVIELYKKSIYEAIRQNRSKDVSSRVTPEMAHSISDATPISVYDFLIRRGRSMLHQITLDEAVRRYLTKVEITISAQGAFYNHLKFNSVELAESGLLEFTKRRGTVKLSAYILELCVSAIWIELASGELIRANYVPPLMENLDYAILTNDESKQHADQINQLVWAQKEQQAAAGLAYAQAIQDLYANAAATRPPLVVGRKKQGARADKEAEEITGGQKVV